MAHERCTTHRMPSAMHEQRYPKRVELRRAFGSNTTAMATPSCHIAVNRRRHLSCLHPKRPCLAACGVAGMFNGPRQSHTLMKKKHECQTNLTKTRKSTQQLAMAHPGKKAGMFNGPQQSHTVMQPLPLSKSRSHRRVANTIGSTCPKPAEHTTALQMQLLRQGNTHLTKARESPQQLTVANPDKQTGKSDWMCRRARQHCKRIG